MQVEQSLNKICLTTLGFHLFICLFYQIELKNQAQIKGVLTQTKLRNESLKEDIAKLQRKLLDQQKNYEAQIRELTEKRALIERLEEENGYFENDNADLKKELEKVREDLEIALLERRDAKFELQKLSIQMNDVEGMNRLLREENERLKLEVVSFEKQISVMKVSISL